MRPVRTKAERVETEAGEKSTAAGRRPARTPSRAVREGRSLRPYLQVVRTLVRDSLWRFKLSSLFVLLTGNLALALQGAALVVLLRYASLLEEDATVGYLGRNWEARTSAELLWLFAAAVALLFGLSALLTYISRTGALGLRHRYEIFCSTRALELLGLVPRVTPAEGQIVADDRTIMKLARRDARYCGRALVSLINAIVPAVTLMAVIAGLFLLELRLTLVLVAVMAVSAGFLYRVNRKGSRAGRSMEATATGAAREYKRTVGWLRGSAFPKPDDPDWLATSLTEHKKVQRHFRAYAQWLRSTENARLVSNLVAAASFVAILGVFGSQILSTGKGFGVMAVYLVALQRGMVSFRNVNQQVSGINRLYPQIKRYLAFVDTSEALLGMSKAERPGFFRLEVTQPALDETTTAVDLDSPARIGVLAPISVNRYSLSLLVDSLFGGSDTPSARYVLRSSAFATPGYEPLAGQSFRTSVGIPAGWTRNELRRALASLAFTDADTESLPALDRSCSEDQWRLVPDGVRFALGVLSAERSTADWIFLDERGLLPLSEEQRIAILDHVMARFAVIVYHHRKPRPGNYGEGLIAVVDGQTLIGLGDVQWFRSHRPAAEAALREGPLAHVVRIARPPYEQEEEDEDDELF